MKKWGKRIVIALAALCGLILLLMTGVLSYLGTTPAHRQIQIWLNRSIPGNMTWTDPDISFWSGRIRLKNLELKDPVGTTLITVEEAGVDVAVGDLVSGEFHVEELFLTRPVLHVVRRKNGGINLFTAFPQNVPDQEPADSAADTPTVPPPVRVDEARITGMSLYWTDHATPMAENPGSGKDGAEDSAGAQSPAGAEIRDLNLSLTGVDIRRPLASLFLSVDNGNIRMPGVKTDFRAIRLSAELEGEKLRIDRLEAESDPGQISLQGAVSDIFSRPDLDLVLKTESDLGALGASLAANIGLTGTARTELTLAGPVSDPQADVRLDITGITPTSENKAWLPSGIALSARLENRVVRLSEITVTGDALSLAGSGQLDLRQYFPEGLTGKTGDPDSLGYSLELSEWQVKPAAFMATEVGSAAAVTGEQIADDPDHSDNNDKADVVAGRLSITGKGVSEAARQLSAEVTAAAGRIMAGPDLVIKRADVKTKLELAGPDLKILELQAAVDGASLTGSGTYHLKNQEISADLSLSVPDLRLPEHRLPTKLPGGTVTADIRVSGTVARPVAELSVLVDNLVRDPLENGRISLYAELTQDGNLRIAELDVSAGPPDAVPESGPSEKDESSKGGRSRILLTGNARLRDPGTSVWNRTPRISVEISRGVVHLADFLAEADGVIHLSGVMDADLSKLQAGGQATAADALSGELRLNAAGIQMAGFRLAEAEASVTPRESGFHLTTDALFSPQSRLAVNGDYLPASGEMRFTAGGSGNLPDVLGKFTPAGFSGSFSLQAEGKGTASAPDISLSADFSDLTLKKRAMPDISVTAAMNGTDITAKADAGFPLSVKLNTESRKFSVDGNLEQVDLTPWFVFAGRSDLAGGLSGKLFAEGGLDQPDRISADLDIASLNLKWKEQPFIRSGPFKASLYDREIRIADADLTLMEQGRLTLNGTGRLDGELDVTAEGNIPLELVQGFAPDLNGLAGTVDLTARLTGAADKPDLVAELRPRDAGMAIPGIADALSGVNGWITLQADSLTVHELDGKLGDGNIRLSGGMGLQNFMPDTADLRLNARELPLAIEEMVDLLVNADIALTGPWSAARLEGTVAVLEGRYYKDIELSLMDAVKKKRTAPPEPGISTNAGAQKGFVQTTEWDVDIIGRNPLWVDNNMAVMSLSPALQIEGKLNNPRITGRASVLEGVVTYQKKEFDIRKGVVDFIDPYSNMPELLIEAETLIRDWTIRLTATGPANQLVIRLSSEPAEEDADIMALLLFEKTTAEMEQGSGESESLTQMAADMLAERLQKNLGEATGLDLVELKYTEGAKGGEGEGVRVAVGKQLSRRLAIKYGVQSKDGQMVQMAAAEYRLLENLLISAFQDSGGSFGGELVYRLEFR